MYPFRIARAANDLIFDEEGRRYIDLFVSVGTAWLGHCHPAVTAAVAEQLGRVWMTGTLETAARAEARALLGSFFPATHEAVALYSTGMEAAEFALRLARVATGRTEVVGFERGMHGKSLATADLCWDNRDGAHVPGFHRVPFVPACPEEETLGRLERLLAGGTVSAVFVEPVQGYGGGYRASDGFYQGVRRLCRQHGALLVFDEILTGLHRTGPPFFFSDLGFVPDVVLVGKGLGNGFPVSAVVADRAYPVRPAMFPGSTFAGNPLAAAAAAATLREIQALDLRRKVGRIEHVIRTTLAPLEKVGVALRGAGAMWVAELPPGPDAGAVYAELLRRGVAAGCAGRHVRLLPPATIDEGNLETACAAVAAVLGEACHG